MAAVSGGAGSDGRGADPRAPADQTPPTRKKDEPRPRLERAVRGRLVAGVCRGLADHLGVDVLIVRLAFVALTTASGLGVAAYTAFWVLVPRRDPDTEPGAGGQGRRGRDWGKLLAYSALTIGLAALPLGVGIVKLALWPFIVGGVGAAILWQQADRDQRQRWVLPLRQRWLRSLVGLLLVVGGIGGVVAQKVDAGQARSVVIAMLIILTGVAVIVTPWVVRLWQDLDAERHERIRSQERAELAAHIHDSVLHTLTLIQRNAADPREVQRLARSQERTLRTWLYQPRADPDQTFAAAIREAAGEVEDDHGVPIEVVCVGDTVLDERLGAALQAAREAMVNAAKYAEAPSVSVYAEVAGEEIAIFVRDRGKGFDLDQVPEDRMGVRGSIIGRMERNGGKATVRTAPGEGTEVRLEIRRS
ncbi:MULTISPECIES: ATP-binding protein [Actinomadura]|uniref:PspC domain-containing protein n=1 Tax=Actinomadura litoris TaxID=2678616 RepID=A0A7K1L8G7_9ACTN|nr:MULTISPECIES: ATP-binding protein [Actinomadura]MBT2210500.1 PspC domain-containing protein [Actinomadura sp. NEAU-AAG7]MUN40506.1 PspC domain-containing protein [Actinomadura litoris]